MTEAFDAFLARGGRGVLRYRLMVEGWAYEWVTSALITHADNRDGREVVTGLSYMGLQLRDRVIMQEGAIEADGMTFRIASSKFVAGGDNATLMFSLYPEPVAKLEEDLDEDDTNADVLAGGFELSNSTVYHLGTEAIRVGTWPTITRHIWDTQAQRHNISRLDATRAVYLYEHPPSMDGRRCVLYAYVDGEDVDGDGEAIWRGMISRPPRLDSDGLTWLLEAEPVTHVLRQRVAGEIATAHPIGMYHHSRAAFLVRFFVGELTGVLHVNGGWSRFVGYAGLAMSEAALIASINTLLEDFAVTELELFESCKLERGADTGLWRITVRTGSSPVKFAMQAGSPILGSVETGYMTTSWRHATSSPYDGLVDALPASSTFFVDLVPSNTKAGDLSFASEQDGITLPRGAITCSPLGHTRFDDDATTLPPNRIYVDRDLEGVEAVHIPGTLLQDSTFAVTATGNTGGVPYIEVELPFGGSHVVYVQRRVYADQPFCGFLTGDTEIQAIRDYGGVGSVADFVAALKTQSVEANDGDTPFVTDADLSTWALDAGAATIVAQQRVYRFVRALGLSELLAEELKLAAHFMRVEADGRIGLAPVPNFTEAENVPSNRRITGASILTPADGRGAWPGWTPQRDGLVTTIEIQQDYDPIEDKWTDTPRTFQDPNAVATHKGRGKALMSIKPYSRLFLDFDPASVPLRLQRVAELYLSIFSQDYSTVTLQVPFKHFGILCGDVVSITHRLIPSGNGTRGVIDRRAVCIERSWNLDPASSEGGLLTFQMANQPTRGYAPAAIVTGYVVDGISSTQWTLTCDTAHAINVAISSGSNGRCLEGFSDGDYIQLTPRQVGTGGVTGQIVGEPDAVAGTCVVLLDDVWDPEDEWVLEFAPDPDGAHSTASQQQFAYVAGSDLRTGTGSFAVRLA